MLCKQKLPFFTDRLGRMDHATQVMSQASGHVVQMNRIAQDTIEMAADTMVMIDDQGNQIHAGRDRVSASQRSFWLPGPDKSRSS